MIDRYSRQTLFTDIGEEGQRKLGNSCVVIFGCGALGTIIATSLVRAGVGKIRIIDRDFIEYHNLQRQVLFNEDDIRNQLPKAIAAERHLRKVNSSVDIEGIVADVNFTNIERFIHDAHIILDGLDNFETRYLINDVSLRHKIPWIYGGAISSIGMTMSIFPGETPCFRCLITNPPGRGTIHTCDTAGVISPAPFIIASLQSVEAMKILVRAEEINRDLIVIDVWKGTFDRTKISVNKDCPACQGKYEFLEGDYGLRATSLCGQDAVQVLNPEARTISLEGLAARLKHVGQATYNQFMLRFTVDDYEMVVFPDARAIIKNTNEESLARALYAKYIGT
ncbi:MAG: ThiF family adenylyltransferase [Deltaproteobacteria bacterium]|jgi:molybdopterin/thiamine biosynthesis adenylyltransferase|nr:MAG: ThiF family adenylyltransferase [Deltaproteobacteria bacterium]